MKNTQSEPNYVLARRGALQQTKARLKAQDKSAQVALEVLKTSSEEARRVEPPHVTQKTRFVMSAATVRSTLRAAIRRAPTCGGWRR